MSDRSRPRRSYRQGCGDATSGEGLQRPEAGGVDDEPGALTRALMAIGRDVPDDRAVAEKIGQACVSNLDVDGASISLLTTSDARLGPGVWLGPLRGQADQNALCEWLGRGGPRPVRHRNACDRACCASRSWLRKPAISATCQGFAHGSTCPTQASADSADSVVVERGRQVAHSPTSSAWYSSTANPSGTDSRVTQSSTGRAGCSWTRPQHRHTRWSCRAGRHSR
jgi:hypothetical protein